jgi:hypothetical protein
MKVKVLIILTVLLIFSLIIPTLFENRTAEKLPEWLTLEHRQKVVVE